MSVAQNSVHCPVKISFDPNATNLAGTVMPALIPTKTVMFDMLAERPTLISGSATENKSYPTRQVFSP